MRPVWYILALAAGAVALAVSVEVAAAPRAGKVVRVERRPSGITGHPRFCTVHPGDMYGYCSGTKAPEVGDRIVAIDHARVLGVLRITVVNPYTDCQPVTGWMIQTATESGDLGSARATVLGVFDVPLDARHAHLVNVDRSPTGHPWGTDAVFAIDNNGDGGPDLEFVQFTCDDSGNQTLTAHTSQCHEVWTAQPGRSFERLRHDRFRTCL